MSVRNIFIKPFVGESGSLVMEKEKTSCTNYIKRIDVYSSCK